MCALYLEVSNTVLTPLATHFARCSYVALQTIYVEQSKKDLADFTAIVKENLAKLGLEGRDARERILQGFWRWHR